MPSFHSLNAIQLLLTKGQLTCVGLVNHYLSNIQLHESLNAFIEVFEEEARIRAEAIDKRISAGTAGSLAGLVIGIKDLICYKGHKVQAASNSLQGFESLYTSTAVQRLLDEDTIVLGRLNCDEFGMGSSSENSCFGPVRNGIDPEYVAGGSSGGSAVAVQMDMCLVSLGTDTGGSVRQPAAFCGVVGMKPTYSRISRYGLIAYGSSLDTIGILSKNIEDNARVLMVMAGHDDMDSTSSMMEVDNYNSFETLSSDATFCYDQELLKSKGLNSDVQTGFEQIVSAIQANGNNVKGIEFPFKEYVLPTYYLLTMAEASSNLSRYDGIHFGHRTKKHENIVDLYDRSRSEGFGDEVKRRLMLGTFVLSAGYYDAYYGKAQKVRRLVENQISKLFESYDYILTPTTPGPAFKVGVPRENPVEMYLEDLFTVQASLTGIPSISVPMPANGKSLPLGIQISSKNFREKQLYSAGNFILNLN